MGYPEPGPPDWRAIALGGHDWRNVRPNGDKSGRISIAQMARNFVHVTVIHLPEHSGNFVRIPWAPIVVAVVVFAVLREPDGQHEIRIELAQAYGLTPLQTVAVDTV